MAIDNDLYNRIADSWWRSDGFLNLLQTAMNPWRVPYFKRILAQQQIKPSSARALDVGCGGGLLTEEFAAMGIAMTGIDPSEPSLRVARTHAAQNGLAIDYRRGDGRQLEFADASFDIAFCCDTLEHIENWDAVIGEIARVLVRGGFFFYDTINRTRASKIMTIQLAQEWRWTRYAPPNTHAWEMFITPDELTAALERHGLRNAGVVGTAPKGNPIQAIWLARQYHTGKISAAGFGRRLEMREGKILSGSYMGHAIHE